MLGNRENGRAVGGNAGSGDGVGIVSRVGACARVPVWVLDDIFGSEAPKSSLD